MIGLCMDCVVKGTKNKHVFPLSAKQKPSKTAKQMVDYCILMSPDAFDQAGPYSVLKPRSSSIKRTGSEIASLSSNRMVDFLCVRGRSYNDIFCLPPGALSLCQRKLAYGRKYLVPIAIWVHFLGALWSHVGWSECNSPSNVQFSPVLITVPICVSFGAQEGTQKRDSRWRKEESEGKQNAFASDSGSGLIIIRNCMKTIIPCQDFA